VERVSVTSDGGQAAPESTLPSISRDGRFVAFHSRSWNLVPNDSNAAVQDVFVRDRAPSIVPFCSGDGTAGACPCGNSGAEGHGCQNSASTGGAILGASGAPSLAHDSLSLASTGGLPSSTCIFLQGSLSIAPVSYGDGLRCIGGSIKRLYLRGASGGAVTAPIGGELAVSARSAALADTIPTGASRYYQVFYRDPNPSFCPAPAGNTWNVSSGVAVAWGY
jgi:hypothetical protein